MPEIKANKWWMAQFPKCSIFRSDARCTFDDDVEDEGDCMGFWDTWCPIMELSEDEMEKWMQHHLQKTNPKVAEEREATINLDIYGNVGAREALA